MNDLNKVMLIGRLTSDPILKYTPNGTAVSSFSLATNRSYNTGGEKKEQVSFFSCVAWNKLGEIIFEYCNKGHRVGIDGRLQQRSWEDQQGNKRSAVEIIVENVQFLQRGENNSMQEKPIKDEKQSGDCSQPMDNPFRDIPF